MSFDFALEKPCPHQVLFETVTLDPTFQTTIRFQRPPFSQLVTLYINGVQVPQTGLYSTASLPFSNPAPYRIISGQSDMFYFQLGQETPFFIQLNPGVSVSANDLAADLNGKLPGGLLAAVQNNRVIVSTPTPINGRAFTFVDPRWSDKTSSLITTARTLGAYSALGIIPGRVVSGYKLFPSWGLARDPLSPLETDRIIQLSEPLRGNQPIVQANYQTTASQCRRCFGIRIEFDYNIVNSTYETVENADLLAQEFDKFLFTQIGSHWKWPWLGSNLINRVGGKGTTGLVNVSALLTSDVTSAFATYQNIKQRQDANFPFQQVSDAEYPLQLTNVSAQQAQDDPTTFLVSASVVSRSRTPVQLTRIIGLPNPLTVLNQGNPQQNLLFAGNPGFLLRG
jgi:hypothetical protein